MSEVKKTHGDFLPIYGCNLRPITIAGDESLGCYVETSYEPLASDPVVNPLDCLHRRSCGNCAINQGSTMQVGVRTTGVNINRL